MIKIFSGTSNIDLSEKISENLSMNLGKVEFIKFSDGETLPVFKENLRGRTVFLIQSCYPPIDNYFQLFQMIQTCKLSSASKIIAVIPYMGFLRQDRKDQPRVGITSKLIADFLQTAGATRVLTIDMHSDQIMGFYNIPLDQLYASYIFLPYIKSNDYKNIIVCSPDTGGTKRAKHLSQSLNSEMVICYKHRSEHNKIDEMILIGDVENKNVIITDDLIDTGGSICTASNLLMEKGAISVRAFVTHPVLSDDAYNNITNSQLSEIFVTDTIPLKQKHPKIKVLSVSGLLSMAIKNIINNKSLSKLFI